MVEVIIALVTVVLQVFGISIGKDGVNINWRRILLWGLLSPVVALVGGRIISVFGDCIEMFKVWSGESGNFSMGLLPSMASRYLFPNASVPWQQFAYSIAYFFGFDRMVGLSVQVLGIRILLKNSERMCSAITAVVHTAIATMSK